MASRAVETLRHDQQLAMRPAAKTTRVGSAVQRRRPATRADIRPKGTPQCWRCGFQITRASGEKSTRARVPRKPGSRQPRADTWPARRPAPGPRASAASSPTPPGTALPRPRGHYHATKPAGVRPRGVLRGHFPHAREAATDKTCPLFPRSPATSPTRSRLRSLPAATGIVRSLSPLPRKVLSLGSAYSRPRRIATRDP